MGIFFNDLDKQTQFFIFMFMFPFWSNYLIKLCEMDYFKFKYKNQRLSKSVQKIMNYSPTNQSQSGYVTNSYKGYNNNKNSFYSSPYSVNMTESEQKMNVNQTPNGCVQSHGLTISPQRHDPLYQVTPHPFTLCQRHKNRQSPIVTLENIKSAYGVNKVNNPHNAHNDQYWRRTPTNNKGSSSIGQLSSESKRFIQDSIKNTLVEREQIKVNKYRDQNSYNDKFNNQRQFLYQNMIISQKHQIPKPSQYQHYTQQSFRPRLHQPSSLDSSQLSLSSRSRLPFSSKKQVLEHFLTDEDQERNSMSQEGIQMLSQLKSQLHSLMNDNVKKLRKENSLNEEIDLDIDVRELFVSKKGMLGNKIEYEGGICQLLDMKLKELSQNIDKLYKKVSSSNQRTNYLEQKLHTNQTLKQSTRSTMSQTHQTNRGQSHAYSKPTPQQNLIYPDSRIIYSRSNDQFVEFSSQFSKIMTDSYNLSQAQVQLNRIMFKRKESHTQSRVFTDVFSQSNIKNSIGDNSESNNDGQLNFQNSQQGREQEDYIHLNSQAEIQRFHIQKQFQLTLPNFNYINYLQESPKSIEFKKNYQIRQSFISSSSNETSVRQINNKFNIQFNQWLRNN